MKTHDKIMDDWQRGNTHVALKALITILDNIEDRLIQLEADATTQQKKLETLWQMSEESD